MYRQKEKVRAEEGGVEMDGYLLMESFNFAR